MQTAHCFHCYEEGRKSGRTDLQIEQIWKRLLRLEAIMTDVVDDQIVRGAQLVGLITAEFASLHTQLDAALADNSGAVDAAVADKASADAERIKGLLDQLAQVLPATVPDVPVPDPGEPAQLPADPPADVSDGSTPAGVTSSDG